MQRFLVGSQDTSHLKIIPVLGYSNKCVISAMTSRGGNRGGNRASREVFPLCCIQSSAHRERCRGGWTRRRFAPTAISAATYWPSAPGGALCRPHPFERRLRDGQWQNPWRERPRDLAGSAITPAATAEVAHATLSLSQSEQAISSMRPARSAKARAICTVSSSAVALDCAVRGRALKALRVASPALRAAGGLDRAIREPLEGNYRRPHVNLLTTRADGAIVEFSSTVAARNPLHIARCGALESAASGHDSFLSRFTSWSSDSRDDTSAEETIGTDCASASGQSADPSSTSDSTSSRCHGTSPVSRRCIGAALSAAHSLQNEHAKPASTFNMGRRIMAERRRHRRERRRQHRPHVRTNANNQIDAQCDEHFARFRPSACPSGCARAVRGATGAPLRRDSLRYASHESRHLRALLVGQPA